MQLDLTSINISWSAPASGGLTNRYDIYYVANGATSTNAGSTTATSYVLSKLQVGVEYTISVIAVGTYLPSISGNTMITLSDNRDGVMDPHSSPHFVIKQPLGPVSGLQAFNNTFTTITLTWLPPPTPNGVIIKYQVTYSTNGVVNTYSTTTPSVTITGLEPRTSYTFSVVGYTTTRPGTPQQVQTSTAAIRECVAVIAVAVKLLGGEGGGGGGDCRPHFTEGHSHPPRTPLI